VALILTLLALGNRNALDSTRTSALSAARIDAVAIAGYDYRHLDRDFGAVLAVSTPSFRRSFTQSSDALKNTLSRYHAIAVAHVVSAGLVSGSTTRAVVLVFLTQKVSNTTQKTSSTDRSQVEITLLHSGGGWLIDQVSLL
jgi:Mce-associated membrane protein